MPARPPIRIRLQGFRCINCRYDLSGNALGDRCPECGWDVNRSLQDISLYTRDYAIRAIGCTLLGVLTALVPLLGLYFAHAAWRWHRGAGACCARERVLAAQFWLRCSRAAMAVAALAALGNAVVATQGAVWAVDWLSKR